MNKNIYIIYSKSLRERNKYLQIKNFLSNNGFNILNLDFHGNTNLDKQIDSILEKVDTILVLISEVSIRSNRFNFELSTVLNKEFSHSKTIIPIKLDETDIPYSLNSNLYINYDENIELNLNIILETINNKKKVSKIEGEKIIQQNNYSNHLKSVSSIYKSGNLVLFCGAGISYDSGIPTWNDLLRYLLKKVFSENTEIPNIDTRLANLFQKRINVSPLILAQYLKTLLGNDFKSTVRNTLYTNLKKNNKTIEAIARLSRQRRNSKPLKAIITFNFDDLIEEELAKENIDYKSIFNEGERFQDFEMPVYHPHGFLPRDKKLTSQNEIVFSEDAYHSQFIDPFSWSNLVQLNHLNNSICLFIGISLTDPNMRRLLDVSIRKNGKEEKNHFIIKKRYKLEDLYPDDRSISVNKKLLPILENIEEQDANNLGFNVIWINDYNEIPNVLKTIYEL